MKIKVGVFFQIYKGGNECIVELHANEGCSSDQNKTTMEITMTCTVIGKEEILIKRSYTGNEAAETLSDESISDSIDISNSGFEKTKFSDDSSCDSDSSWNSESIKEMSNYLKEEITNHFNEVQWFKNEASIYRDTKEIVHTFQTSNLLFKIHDENEMDGYIEDAHICIESLSTKIEFSAFLSFYQFKKVFKSRDPISINLRSEFTENKDFLIIELIKDKKCDVYLVKKSSVLFVRSHKFKIEQSILEAINACIVLIEENEINKIDFTHPEISVGKGELMLLALVASTQNAVFCVSREGCGCHQQHDCTLGCKHGICTPENCCSSCGDGWFEKSTHQNHVRQENLSNARNFLTKAIEGMKYEIAVEALRAINKVIDDSCLKHFVSSPYLSEIKEFLEDHSGMILALSTRLNYKYCSQNSVYYTVLDKTSLPCKHGEVYGALCGTW